MVVRKSQALAGPRLSSRQVWDAVAHASFAVLSHVTAAGAPRSSGVVYLVSGGSMYAAVAPDSWKARHIGADGRVAVTVPIRRGGMLASVFPIPPMTISFAGVATLHTVEALDAVPGLARLVPPERRDACTIVEVRPVGHFVTYGVGVPLLAMRDPARSRARTPVA
ncbi:pyridoxamine 5'-phosphate oxidase family protein [Couchioplanes caeruleus]|uniref:pyridoxamine 5'-phosphate oxidase family protein n=1 Tax=Couchioplanes caeruleus TaxID=56438 RepID=UPI0020C0E2F5|nr:pyridoxamine 5'-phosphate oxidase family protein [Couchioplanes caeruleus]UQU67795.1 pyridoxamine 5'-phosphate oxidase family protein [Couchioplanes caeruleus]